MSPTYHFLEADVVDVVGNIADRKFKHSICSILRSKRLFLELSILFSLGIPFKVGAQMKLLGRFWCISGHFESGGKSFWTGCIVSHLSIRFLILFTLLLHALSSTWLIVMSVQLRLQVTLFCGLSAVFGGRILFISSHFLHEVWGFVSFVRSYELIVWSSSWINLEVRGLFIFVFDRLSSS